MCEMRNEANPVIVMPGEGVTARSSELGGNHEKKSTGDFVACYIVCRLGCRARALGSAGAD
jgi:hypothetical protein